MTDNEIIKACGEMCTDNRFELIKKYKELLIEGTNIETSANEMAVIDNILFRVWQMGWLNKLEESTRMKKELDRLEKLYKLAVAEREANVKGFTEALETAKADAIKDITGYLESEIEDSDKRISDFDTSDEERGYNKGLRVALSYVQEFAEGV